MKKILSIIVSLVLVLSLCMTANAAGGTATLNGNGSVTVGSNIVLTVKVSGCADATSVAASVSFGSDFEYVSASWIKSGSLNKAYDTSTGKGALGGLSSPDINGDLYKITLKAKTASANNQTVSITIIAKNDSTEIMNTVASKQIKINCATHSYDAYQKVNDSQHKRTCSACGNVETTNHTWNDMICNDCGYDKTHYHSFGSTWVDGNDGYHYHVCTTTGCTAKDTANRQEHTGGTATCEAAKTCSVCTKSYGEKDMNNHTSTATNIVPNNNGTHDIKYTCCGTVKNDDVACSGGTATCVAEAICEHCNTAYGNKDATNHTSNEFIFVDNGDGTHTKKNKCCNAIVSEPEAHAFGDDNICDICNYDKTHYCGNGTLVKGKAATCTENGVKDSYKCSCGKIYLDATCKTLVTSEDELVIKSTGVHTDADKNNKCDECEAIIDKTVTSPQTGDNSNIALWIALAFVSLASLTGLTIYGKKKRNQA